MILYTKGNLKVFETCSAYPKSDWTGKADFVIDETDPNNAELLSKIKRLAPCFDYVTYEGKLIDIVENDVVLPKSYDNVIENVNYDVLAAAIQEGVNEV
jgi:hypothetical protein